MFHKWKDIKDKKYTYPLHKIITDKLFFLRRKLKFAYQKRTRGFSDEETWSLDHSLAQLILPRLKRFKEVNIGHPSNQTLEEWNQKLDSMIEAFEFIASEEYWMGSTEQYKKAEKGLKLFAKYYMGLWW